jgi:hypothetical protein
MMQGIMWLIFGVTLGCAALIVHGQRRARQVVLSARPVVVQGLSVRLPNNWRARQNPQDKRIIAEVTEPAPGGRTMTVYRDRLGVALSPVEYLAQSFDVQFKPSENVEELDQYLRATQFGDQPGVIVTTAVPVPGHTGEAARKEIFGAAILPSGNVISIKLQGTGAVDLADLNLVETVAQAMQITDEPRLETPGQAVTLAGGISLTAPSAFRFVQQRDANKTSRRLWYTQTSKLEQFEAQWAAIEVVPCLFPFGDELEKEGSRADLELLTMLLARDDIRWRGATVRAMAQGQYRADAAADLHGEIFASRAYLQTDPSGHALLAIMRAPEADLEGHWNQLRATVRFSGASEFGELTRAGADEAARLRELPLDQLLKDREDTWYLWLNQSSEPHLGYTHIEWTPNQIAAEVENRWRMASGSMLQVLDTWNASSDWNRYRSDATRILTPDGGPAQVQRQRVELRGDTLTLSAVSAGKAIEQWKRMASKSYLPASIVEQLIGKLSPTPMTLRSESFPGYDAMGISSPLMLIVRPAKDRGPSTRAATQALRCVTVEVNGTGEISRWYLQADGTVDSVDFPDGIQRLESNERSIRFEFAQDPAMLQ